MYVVVMQICAVLYYSLSGGVDKKETPCKTPDMLRKAGSALTDCAGALQSLISGGFGDPDNRWWALLSLLGAPTEIADFRKFAPGVVLRMSSAIDRRYMVKYSSWLFPLFKLCCDEWPMSEKRRVAQDLFASKECCLDAFARGFRKLFPTIKEALSEQAAACARNAFESMRVVTDFSERAHAQCRCASRAPTGPRSFGLTSSEVLLKQAAVVHVQGGGDALGQPGAQH